MLRPIDNATVLVTGGTGLIGTNLVRALTERGERVRVLRRRASDLRGLEGLPIEHHLGSVLDPTAVARAVAGCTRIFHLAGDVSMQREARPERDINIVGAANVARAAVNHGVEKVVFTSSAVTIGYGTRERPATEDQGLCLDFLKVPYVESKKRSERLVRDYVRRGLPAVIVNPGYVLGPWDKRPKLSRLLITAARHGLPFYFRGGLNVVDVRDVVQGHLLAMERGRVGQRYVLGNANLSFREFLSAVHSFFHDSGGPRYCLPAAGVAAVVCVDRAISKLQGQPSQLSRSSARLFNVPHYVSSAKARAELGYRTTSLAETLGATASWLRDYGYLS